MGKRNRKKRKKGASGVADLQKSRFSNRPFRGLKLPAEPDSTPASVLEEAVELKENLDDNDDESLYQRAMLDVEPLGEHKKLAEREHKPKPLLLELDEDELVMRQLDDLVHGEVPFDFADTEEYIEAVAEGIDRRLVRKLRKGEFAVQAHLDLHGLNREEARAEVSAFIRKCHLRSKRCVLIVHGRGMRSEGNIPVLKIKLAAWLTRGAIGRRVLAFTSARPYDGGTGAVYVLLRQ